MKSYLSLSVQSVRLRFPLQTSSASTVTMATTAKSVVSVQPRIGRTNEGNGRVAGFVLAKRNTESSLYEMKRPKSHYVGESVFQVFFKIVVECFFYKSSNKPFFCSLKIFLLITVTTLVDSIKRHAVRYTHLKRSYSPHYRLIPFVCQIKNELTMANLTTYVWKNTENRD